MGMKVYQLESCLKSKMEKISHSFKMQYKANMVQVFLGFIESVRPRPVKMRSKDAALKGIERKDCSTKMQEKNCDAKNPKPNCRNFAL